MNDIEDNILNLKRSSKNIKFNLFTARKDQTKNVYQQLHGVLNASDNNVLKKLQAIFIVVDNNYTTTLNNFYANAKINPIESADMTVAINFNRELFSSNNTMVIAVKDFIFNEKQSQEWDALSK